MFWNTVLDNYRIYNDNNNRRILLFKNIHPVINQIINKNDKNNNDNRFYR